MDIKIKLKAEIFDLQVQLSLIQNEIKRKIELLNAMNKKEEDDRKEDNGKNGCDSASS